MEKILIIDDEIKILEVLEAYLKSGNFVVISAGTGHMGMEKFYEQRPDAVITDIMLPDMTGEEILKEIRKVSDIPVIMLTAKIGENNIIRNLENGADDYIVKPFSPKELIARLKTVLRRYHRDFSKKITFNNQKLIFDTEGKKVLKKGEDCGLTNFEYRILESMALKPGRVFSRDEIINLVTGYGIPPFDRTVDAHIKNIRNKIEDDSKNPEFILTVYGAGYKFKGVRDEND